MLSFYLYCISTIAITSYFTYDLNLKENDIFVKVIAVTQSKFLFLLTINFVIMLVLIIGKILIYLLYGAVRQSEITVY
ncbi:MAG: hypothetical protein MJ252_11900 [archaeon]|nr:hypothetical protein [archaeon]